MLHMSNSLTVSRAINHRWLKLNSLQMLQLNALLFVTGRRGPGPALFGHLGRRRADDDAGRPGALRPEGLPLLRRLLPRVPRRTRILATHHGEWLIRVLTT